MLDIHFIRENPEKVQVAVQQKGYNVDIALLLQKDQERRELQTKVDELRARRKNLGKGRKNEEHIQVEEAKFLKTELLKREQQLHTITIQYQELLKAVPNIPWIDVPIGATEQQNIVVKTVGEATQFSFNPRNHAEISEQRGWIDRERAAKVAGARFAYIKGDLAKLHFALFQWGIDAVTNEVILRQIAENAGLQVNPHPFTLVIPPLMLRTEPYDAMDRLEPREERYKIEGEELWLQGSAEHVLSSMHMNEVIDEKAFPIRYVGYAPSFRREAGTYGKDMEGIFRLHQFTKLEMASLTTPEDSFTEHLFMIAIEEYLMQQLQLPYRVLNKCTADIGKPNARGFDIEVWLPGQNRYRETHTADYMTDYQARRLRTKVRRHSGETEFVHTNDATVFSQRPLIAIIENFQCEDGTVVIPEVLRPYMGDKIAF